MNKLTPRVSVFVPAHNEEKYIAECLDSLLRQTVAPYEIIVVDNNSTDRTAEIVKSYKSVKLVQQLEPGILPTRSAGFNAARGDIIARTDADCRAETNWVERIQQNFAKHPHTAAISGPFYYYDMPAARFGRSVEMTIRGELDRYSKQSRFLAGANMAIRREVWQAVEPHLCHDDTIHEDLDIAIHLNKLHYHIGFDRYQVVGTSARRLGDGVKAFYRYIQAYEHTYNSHGIFGATLKVPIMVYFPVYPVLRVLRRFYNEETNRLSLKQLLNTVPKSEAKRVVRHHKD